MAGGCVSRISTHVLDTALGRPAAAMAVQLEYAGPSGLWEVLNTGETDGDGRCANLLPHPILHPGQYRLSFDTGTYHAAQSIKGLYLTVVISVMVREGDTHLHIPLLLSPNGYTTYRGS
jgi:5-hydroxyisourate hydrolase